MRLAKEIIEEALVRKDKSQRWLAAQLGVASQNLNRKIVRNTLSAQELVDAAEVLGCRVVLLDNDSNEELKPLKPGVGPRLRQMIDGVWYDTGKADAICHTDPVAGWFMELYQDRNGHYFVAHYTDWAGSLGHLSVCGAEDAKRLRAVCDVADNLDNVDFTGE